MGNSRKNHMATAPMQSTGMDGIAPEGQQDAQAYEICIKVSAQGISVGVEPAAQEAAEPAEQEYPSQPVKSAEEAAQMVMKIIQSNGQMGGGDAEMQAGFAQGAMA